MSGNYEVKLTACFTAANSVSRHLSSVSMAFNSPLPSLF